MIFYCIFTGNSPSIVRATVMGILLLIAYESERKTNFYNVAGFSALAILIIDPRQIFDPSFILSYTAVITMVLLYEKMKPLLLDHVNLKEYRYGIYAKAILILIVTTFAAQIGVLPVASSYFEKVSVISIIANLIVVPVANLSLGIGFMQIITGIFSEYLSSLIAQTNQLLLNFQLWFIKQCASVDFAYFEIYRFDIVNIIFYFIIVTVIFTITKENLRQRIIVVVLIFISVLLYNIEPENKFRMTFLDVGEGSSLVIENTDGKVVLINTGIKKQTYNSGERTIIPYLKRRGLEKIDLLIITDDNPENTGGLEYISGNFPVGKLIFANSEKSDIDVKEGDLIDSFEDLRIYFLSPVSTTSGNINLKISYRDLDILIVSHQNETERSYLTIKYDDFLDADILHSKNISLFNHIPQIYVTPSEENLPEDKKSQLNRIVNTNKKGAFIVESTGENIEIIDWR